MEGHQRINIFVVGEAPLGGEEDGPVFQDVLKFSSEKQNHNKFEKKHTFWNDMGYPELPAMPPVISAFCAILYLVVWFIPRDERYEVLFCEESGGEVTTSTM